MTNEIIYAEKYIKYKNKYFKLKQLIGGANKNIIIVATHSYRLQCILNEMRVNSIDKYQSTQIKRFKNCAVVRVYRDTDHASCSNTCVEIIFQGIYTGIIDPKDTSHFEKADVNKVILKLNNPNYAIPENVEIYFIRHGEGVHNIDKKPDDVLLDAELTLDGNKQALEAGDVLNKYFTTDKYVNSKYYYCASDLHRTHETIGNIKHILNKNNKGNASEPIFVVSCVHEITPNKHETIVTEPNCDNPTNLAKTSIYNNPKCSIGNQQGPACQTVIIKIDGVQHNIKIDWSKHKITRENCNGKNIIQELLAEFR
jgi:uncharacterized CHY-type Zn-finger protein